MKQEVMIMEVKEVLEVKKENEDGDEKMMKMEMLAVLEVKKDEEENQNKLNKNRKKDVGEDDDDFERDEQVKSNSIEEHNNKKTKRNRTR